MLKSPGFLPKAASKAASISPASSSSRAERPDVSGFFSSGSASASSSTTASSAAASDSSSFAGAGSAFGAGFAAAAFFSALFFAAFLERALRVAVSICLASSASSFATWSATLAGAAAPSGAGLGAGDGAEFEATGAGVSDISVQHRGRARAGRRRERRARARLVRLRQGGRGRGFDHLVAKADEPSEVLEVPVRGPVELGLHVGAGHLQDRVGVIHERHRAAEAERAALLVLRLRLEPALDVPIDDLVLDVQRLELAVRVLHLRDAQEGRRADKPRVEQVLPELQTV